MTNLCYVVTRVKCFNVTTACDKIRFRYRTTVQQFEFVCYSFNKYSNNNNNSNRHSNKSFHYRIPRFNRWIQARLESSPNSVTFYRLTRLQLSSRD